jgi:phage portal protein BeeE
MNRVLSAILRGPKVGRRGFVWPFPSEGSESFVYAGQQYFGTVSVGAGTPSHEPAPFGYAQLAAGPFRSNPIVFACELRRILVFSEARFLFREVNDGRPGKLFHRPRLEVLMHPWPRGSTGDLLANMIVHADIGGNAFVARSPDDPDRLRLLRPDWVTIVMGDRSGRPVVSAAQLDAEIVGFIYDPRDGLAEAEALTADEVAHWAPIPDPLARFRGMSWLTPVLREAQADQAASEHKLAFFENGATPQLVVSFGPEVSEDAFNKFVAKMDDSHSGWRNAYRTLYLGGGANVTVAGKDLRQLDFSATQGKGETRIAAASGIHPVLVPLSEGMQGSALNAGNYAAARRSTADMTFRPLWRSVAAALGDIVPAPGGAELWYDEQFIPFLREDAKDAAEIELVKAETITKLVREGFAAESAVNAVLAQDMTLLEHAGLVSVQLQPPGTGQPMPEEPSPNGNGAMAELST